jgi:hypothetical protein
MSVWEGGRVEGWEGGVEWCGVKNKEREEKRKTNPKNQEKAKNQI